MTLGEQVLQVDEIKRAQDLTKQIATQQAQTSQIPANNSSPAVIVMDQGRRGFFKKAFGW